MGDMTDDTQEHKNAGRQAVARYRQRNRRFDYSPSPEVLAVIEHHRSTGTEKVLAGVLDMLVLAGHRSITGNKSGAGRLENTGSGTLPDQKLKSELFGDDHGTGVD